MIRRLLSRARAGMGLPPYRMSFRIEPAIDVDVLEKRGEEWMKVANDRGKSLETARNEIAILKRERDQWKAASEANRPQLKQSLATTSPPQDAA